MSDLIAMWPALLVLWLAFGVVLGLAWIAEDGRSS